MTRLLLRISARVFVLLFFACSIAGPSLAQTDDGTVVERTFPCSVDAMQKALQQIGGFGGGKLPLVDGFVAATAAQMEHYERPYYQYRVHLRPVDANNTVISVEAMISAWYADPDPKRSEYRALPSNGRLEADLLDRLQRALDGTPSPSTLTSPAKTNTRGSAPMSQGSPNKAAKLAASPAKLSTASQEQLDTILAQRQAVREKTAALQAKLEQLKTSDRKPANASSLASIKHSGVGVMSRQNFGGPVLFRAQAEDEFEVMDLQSGWAQVRLGPDTTGYIQADELTLPDGFVAKDPSSSADSSQSPSAPAQRDLGFSVSREDVTVFSGDWSRLKGKKVLFVYAQPRGLLSDMANQDAKLGYAKRIFQSRYRTVSQSQTEVEGVVVVFLGARGGIAAATLTDIRQWVEGGLPDEAFVNRCSLDPATEFRAMRIN